MLYESCEIAWEGHDCRHSIAATTCHDCRDDSPNEYMHACMYEWINIIVCIFSNDTRPGLVPDRVARQYQREVKHTTLNTVNREQNKPRKALETENREEGLKNALPADNKGFKLLEKMGYKPGTAIGKTGEI